MKLFIFLIKTVFSILLCEKVSSKTQIVFNDQNDVDLLGKFFAEFKEAYLEKLDLRQIAIVGGSPGDLKRVQPLLESYPYSICEWAENCRNELDRFHRGSFVIVFIDDLNKKKFSKQIIIRKSCDECRFLLVSDASDIQVDEISHIFTLAKKYGVPRAEFALFGKNVVHLHTNYIWRNCSAGVRLITVWKPGVVCLPEIDDWTSRVRDMNGCPVTVTTLNVPPKMIIERSDNGSSFVFYGQDGQLLSEIAAKLNFTVNLKYLSMEDAKVDAYRVTALFMDMYSANSEINIGRLALRQNAHEIVSVPYDRECVAWGVPRLMKWSNGILWMEFSRQVWVWVCLIFVIQCVIGHVDQNLNSLKNGERRNFGFVAIVLDNLAVHLGNPVVHVSSSAGGKFMLIVYLYYTTVMTTAYKSSLSAILATNEGTPKIVDEEGILRENIMVGGTKFGLELLQASENKIAIEIAKRYIVNSNRTGAVNRLMFDNNYALLKPRSYLNYVRQRMIKSGETVNFDILDDCVTEIHVVMYLSNKSMLREPIDSIIRRLTESGIMDHWDSDDFDGEKLLKRKMIDKYFEERGTDKFQTIFVFYFGCIAFCLITFFLELCTGRHRRR